MALTRFRSLLTPLLALLLLLAACGQTQSTTFSSIGGALSPGATPSAAPSVSFPLTLTDDAGRTVTLAAAPKRIVSLAPSNTEIVCALGACSELTGVTDRDPRQLRRAARPDLVLAAGNGLTPEAAIKQLTDLGLHVMTLYPKALEGVYKDISLVGRALGVPDLAQSTVTSMQARVKAVTDTVGAASRPRTFYEVSVFEGTIYTAGKDSFLSSLITLAGGDPVTGDAQSGAIQLEDLIAADPELILLGDASYDPTLATRDKALATVRARSGWEKLSAVRSGKVLPFTDDVVTTRPGPRIVDGLEALAKAIHPELFGS